MITRSFTDTIKEEELPRIREALGPAKAGRLMQVLLRFMPTEEEATH